MSKTEKFKKSFEKKTEQERTEWFEQVSQRILKIRKRGKNNLRNRLSHQHGFTPNGISFILQGKVKRLRPEHWDIMRKANDFLVDVDSQC